MKKLLLSVIVLMITGTTSAFSQVKIYNDQRDELSGIVWRLAGAEEFNKNISDKKYAKDIKTYFAKFTKHPIMDFIRSMREEPLYVGYDAVSGAADVLKIENGEVKISSVEDVVKLTTQDTRWTIDNMNRYAVLLNDFYGKSKFEQFYTAHQPVYQRYIDSLKVVVDGIDTQWFESFYGIPLKDFEVTSCPSYDVSNFGSISDFEITIGGWFRLDVEQKYNNGLKNVILHELNHVFSYKIIEPYLEQMRPAAEKIFPYVEEQVTKLGHGEALTVVQESLNELFTIMYSKETKNPQLIYRIFGAYHQGYLWTDKAIKYMDTFYANRDIYPSIADFMPKLVEFINLVPNDIDELAKNYKNAPKIVSSFPAHCSAVSDTLKEVRFRFSHPMLVGMCHNNVIPSVLSFQKPYNKNDKEDGFYWADDYTLVYPVTVALKKGKQYGTQIGKGVLRRKDTGVTVQKTYDLIFTVE